MFAGLMLAGVGVLFLAIAAYSAVRVRQFLRAAVDVQGTVAAFEEQTSTDSEGATTSSTHPVVQFSTADGVTIKFTEKTQTFGGLSVGEAVSVKYDPAKPERARLATGVRLWITAIVLGSLGVLLLIPGVIILLVAA